MGDFVVQMPSAARLTEARPNAKTRISNILVVFIFFSFQKLLIFSRRPRVFLSKTRAGAALFVAVLLLKNQLFGLVGPTLINGKKKAT